nr:tetratricopeptide repeat protein [Bacteroidota bacterium]
MKIILKTCYLGLLFISIGMSGQTTSVRDSLLAVITGAYPDTIKAMGYADLSKYYQGVDHDTALFWAREGLLFSNSIDYKKGMGELYACMGDIEVNKDSLDAARDYYLESVRYFIEIKDEPSLTQVRLVLGNIYISQDNYFDALIQYQEAVILAEKLEFNSALEHLYNNIGVIYQKLEKYDDALSYYNKALDMSKELGSFDVRVAILRNIGTIYSNKRDFKLAETYFFKAHDLAKELKDKRSEAICLRSLGDIKLEDNKPDAALQLYFEALDCARNIDPSYRGPKSIIFCEIYSTIGKAYYYKNEYDKAINYLLQCYNIASETGQIRIISESTELLSKSYKALGNVNEALKYYEYFKTSSDSLLNENNIRKITEVEMQYKFDKIIADKEFEQARKQAIRKRAKIIQMSITIASVLSVIILLLLYFLLRNKIKSVELKRKNLQLEKATLTNDLDFKNKELTTNVLYLLKKNEFILNISQKLKKARFVFKQDGRKVAEEIIRDLEINLSTDSWKEFEVRFQEVHSDFYKKLIDNYPDLSPNELKLCAFLRLNMSTKEIAAITYLSANSINMARYRLRKKLNIDQDENLIVFLSSL